MKTVSDLVLELETLGLRCDAGPLEGSQAWCELRRRLTATFGVSTVDELWVELGSGERFEFMSPDPDTIHIEDVAGSLSKMCRFNGHTRKFYSVAEHSVLLSRWTRRNLLSTGRMCLTALLHDASEAFTGGDLPTPIKHAFPALGEMEGEIEAAVAARFDVELPKPFWLKEIDRRIILDEREQAMSDSGRDWGLGMYAPLGVRLHFWTPSEAEDNFMGDYHELNGREL